MKHIFPSDEIAHLWMHRTQDSARKERERLAAIERDKELAERADRTGPQAVLAF